MPLYEYECEACGHIEEVLQKVSETPLTTCGKCSGKLHKLISHSTFHLKGSGWYVTDYANRKTHGPQSNTPPDTAKKESAPAASGGSEKTSS